MGELRQGGAAAGARHRGSSRPIRTSTTTWGDAYWRAGRKIEARFQWERVLTLDPDDKLRTEVEGKLKTGLGIPSKVAQADAPAMP